MTDAPADIPAAAAGARIEKVALQKGPIRDGKPLAYVQLRKPKGGELRGVDGVALLRMDYAAVAKILPRISMPMISSAEYLDLEADDCQAIAGQVSDFLLTSQQKAEAGLDA